MTRSRYVQRFIAAFLATALIVSTPAAASHVQPVKVRYETEDGRSQWYNVDVTFVTGAELNEATRSFRYGGFDKYGVIFWGERQATVIKLRGFFACGMEFEASCLPSIGTMRGLDQQERAWEICAQSICF